MAKRGKRIPRPDRPTHTYTDDEGNTLTLRETVSWNTARKIRAVAADGGTSVEDAWHRRSEMMFEYFAVSWEISGLPLDDQSMLLGRYRMASPDEQRWVRETLRSHAERFQPEIVE